MEWKIFFAHALTLSNVFYRTIVNLILVMETNGYICSPQPHKPKPHLMFLKGYTTKGFLPPVFHVHIRYPGKWDEIYFRDYLLKHPEIAKEYGSLKLKLKEEFEHDRDGYTNAKTEFIQRITQFAKKMSLNYIIIALVASFLQLLFY